MIEDAVLREISVNWFPATNEQVREMALELLKTRAVVRAAESLMSEDGAREALAHYNCLHILAEKLEELSKTINP